MLDFQKLIPQIVALASESSSENNLQVQILSLAQASYEEAGRAPLLLEKTLKENAGKTFWMHPLPLEPFASQKSVSLPDINHAVVACDGSQIMPSRHEVHGCFLLNVGAAVLSYGKKGCARLLSYPRLYFKQDEIYPLINKRRVYIDEALLSFERNLLELEKAFSLAESLSSSSKEPVLALIDGSLIPFSLERYPDRFQRDLLERYQSRLHAFCEAGLPVVGYISHSRSSEIVNILRVFRCPHQERLCHVCCGALNEDEYPCSAIQPLSDRQLLASKLPLKSRSGFFRSSSPWSTDLKPEVQICFAYLNSGWETARIEAPYWLFADKKLLEFALSALLLQIEKGQGYPLGLSEAHNQAVIRQADRNRFYQLLSEQLMLAGKSKVRVSPKESKKRRGFV